jgi:sugar phosphate permease
MVVPSHVPLGNHDDRPRPRSQLRRSPGHEMDVGRVRSGSLPGRELLSLLVCILFSLCTSSTHPVFTPTSWYKRSEFGIRAAVFFSAATVSGAFGGLLAAAISNMDGVGGKPGWAWIFILEGLLTVLAGIASFFIIQDFPDTAKFLSDEERVFVIRRLQDDAQFSAAGEEFKMRYVWHSIFDWKTWVAMLIYTGVDGPLYAFALFLPSIINQLGFKSTPANLLTVPVYVTACIFTCGVGFAADKYGHRGWFNIGFMCVGIAGYVILVASRNAALSYFAVYLAAMCVLCISISLLPCF